MLTKDQLQDALLVAIRNLKEKDGSLLRNDANERAITHKLAEYLEPHFSENGGWDIDCEYNRDEHDTKKLRYLADQTVSQEDTDGQTVFPDIIVHHREQKGRTANLLVVEVKKSRSREGTDRDKKKLRAFKTDPNLEYQFAVSIVLKVGDEWEGAPTIDFV